MDRPEKLNILSQVIYPKYDVGAPKVFLLGYFGGSFPTELTPQSYPC